MANKDCVLEIGRVAGAPRPRAPKFRDGLESLREDANLVALIFPGWGNSGGGDGEHDRDWRSSERHRQSDHLRTKAVCRSCRNFYSAAQARIAQRITHEPMDTSDVARRPASRPPRHRASHHPGPDGRSSVARDGDPSLGNRWAGLAAMRHAHAGSGAQRSRRDPAEDLTAGQSELLLPYAVALRPGQGSPMAGPAQALLRRAWNRRGGAKPCGHPEPRSTMLFAGVSRSSSPRPSASISGCPPLTCSSA